MRTKRSGIPALLAALLAVLPKPALPAVEAAKASKNGANGRSQEIKGTLKESEGLITAKFNTPDGEISLNLPAIGRQVSGTVVGRVAPGGTPEQQQERSGRLNGYVLAWENQRVEVAEKKSFSWEVPAAVTGFVLLELWQGDRKVGHTYVRVPERPIGTVPADFDVPRFLVDGDNVVCQGPFNGNVADTDLSWNGAGADLIAESEVMAVAAPLRGKNGPGELAVSDNGKSATREVNKVGLELSTNAGPTLLKGTSANVEVAVRSLQNLQEGDKLSLRVQINSENIAWAGIPGRVFYTPISKNDLVDDAYQKTLTFNAIAEGPYEIEATLCTFLNRHGEFLSNEPVHAWQTSDLPRHDAGPSGRNAHTAELSATNHNGTTSAGTPHDPDTSWRVPHSNPSSSRPIGAYRASRHRQEYHSEAPSTRPLHTEEVSGFKTHSPALTVSAQPTHGRELSNRARHEAAWSNSTVTERPKRRL